MFRNENFGKWIGAFGKLSGLGLLVLSLWIFPYPPAQSGLIDLGPATGVWWVWVIVLMVKID